MIPKVKGLAKDTNAFILGNWLILNNVLLHLASKSGHTEFWTQSLGSCESIKDIFLKENKMK